MLISYWLELSHMAMTEHEAEIQFFIQLATHLEKTWHSVTNEEGENGVEGRQLTFSATLTIKSQKSFSRLHY